MTLPQKTTEEDINIIAAYLKNQVGWTSLTKVRSTVDARHANGLKIEAMRFLGLLDRNGEDVKLSDAGREYAAATPEARAALVAAQLRTIPLFSGTVEWMHYQKHHQPSKTEIANYWHDKQSDKTGGVTGDALTDGAVFFLRVAGMAGLGKFVAAGTGRDTHLKGDENAIEAFATGRADAAQAGSNGKQHTPSAGQSTAIVPVEPKAASAAANVSTDVNINVQIHIAADAKPETVREVFRNMRRYVLNQPDLKEDSK